MTSAASGTGAVAQKLRYEIGDSILTKVIAAIPVVGVIMQIWTETEMSTPISEAVRYREKERTIRLIESKNHYKIAGIVRDVLTIAALVTIVALNLLVWN